MAPKSTKKLILISAYLEGGTKMKLFEELRDNVYMRTSIFSKGNPLRTNSTMKDNTIKDDAARKKFVEDFHEGFYKETGNKAAEKIVRNINAGTLYYADPIYYMDNLADQDDMMLAVAAYLAENAKTKKVALRPDYLSNKFIKALNEACVFLGLPKYINVTDEYLEQDREIVWDDPDYSQLSEDAAKVVKEINKLHNEVVDFFEKDKEKTLKEVAEYNAKLMKEAEKELKEEEKKQAEKDAKKAKKDAEKNEEQKVESAKTTSNQVADPTANVKAQVRNRSGVTKGVSNGNSSAGNSSAGKGGSGSDDSSDSGSGDGDPDPHQQGKKSKINLDEVIPPEKIYPLLEITDDERKNEILAQAERERLAFIQANSGQMPPGMNSEAMQKIYGVANMINSGALPSTAMVQDAIDAASEELRQRSTLRTVNYETGRFTSREINGRTDLQLMQDSLNEACRVMPNITASVTPSPDGIDKYKVFIMKDNVMVDTFDAYGSRLFGKGCPVLDGIVDLGNNEFIEYFVPFHSLLAIRQNIFRNIEVENIDGQLVRGPQGTNKDLAEGLRMTICKDVRLLDHLDVSTMDFNSDEEAHAFFHVAGAALNAVSNATGVGQDSLPRYRIFNYRQPDVFELIGDSIAYRTIPMYKAVIPRKPGKKVPADNIGPDNRRIIVNGKNITIVQPDGNTIQSTLILEPRGDNP